MNNKIIFLIFGLMLFNLVINIIPVNAEIINYESDNSTANKTLQIDDIANIKYLNDYPYRVYINNNFLGTYTKDELIFIPDNSNVTIYVPSAIKTDFSQSWDVGKVYLTIAVMYLLGFGIVIFLIAIFIKKIWSK